MIEPNQIKSLRKSLNLTQKQLSNKTNLSQSYITKIENELIEPSYSSMKKLSLFFESVNFENTLNLRDIYHKEIYFVLMDSTIKEVSVLFDKKNISQAPVRDKDNNLIGILTERSLILGLKNNLPLEKCIEPLPPILDENVSIEIAKILLLSFPMVLVQSKGKVKGLVTRIDLLKNI